MNKQIVAAFDFDGTITKRDTLLPFLRKYGLSKLTKATCKASLRAGNRNFRNILKETTLNEIFYDYSSEKFETDGDAYASTLPQLYRSEILKARNSLHRIELLNLMRRLIQAKEREAKIKKNLTATDAADLPGHPVGVKPSDDEDPDGPTENLETDAKTFGLDPAGAIIGRGGSR